MLYANRLDRMVHTVFDSVLVPPEENRNPQRARCRHHESASEVVEQKLVKAYIREKMY